jgi:hypothetical protein
MNSLENVTLDYFILVITNFTLKIANPDWEITKFEVIPNGNAINFLWQLHNSGKCSYF